MAEELENELGEEAKTPTRTRTRAVAKVKEVLEGDVIPEKVMLTMTTSEYMQYSKDNGTYMGRPLGEKTQLSTEEFVVLSQDGWTPKQIMDKHGIDLVELQNVADRVPLIMQLKRRIVVTDKTIKW